MKKTLSFILALCLIVGLVSIIPSFAADTYTDKSSWKISASSDGMGGISGAFDGNV